jgi:kinesin family protein 2/24
MDDKADHVPFRASKLTLILRDSFVNKSNSAKVIMIACISPGSSSSDHSLNTLRYADRLKDQTELSKKCDEIIQQNRSLEAKQEVSKENIHKIDSAKMIRKEEPPKQVNPSVNKSSVEPKNVPKNIPKSTNSIT